MGAEQGVTIMAGAKVSEKPSAPVVPPALKQWTEKWSTETGESADYRDACKQYEQDLETLFPDEHLVSTGQLSRRGGKARPRNENRIVAVPRVYQYSLQTLALLCPGDLSIKIEGRNEIPPMGQMGATAGTKSRDPYLDQFARTIDDRLQRHFEDCDFMMVLREFARHCIWFQNGVLKLGYQREILDGALIHNRMPDAQDNIERIKYLTMAFMRGDFTEQDEDYLTLKQLIAGLGDQTEVEVWQNLVGENISLNRFICDPRVESLAQMRSARWMGDLFVLTGEELLTWAPYVEQDDPIWEGKTWQGVHEDDLLKATPMSSEGGKALVDKARDKSRRKDEVGSKTSPNQKRDRDQALKDMYLVREIWAASEGNLVFWLVDGIDYPIKGYRPKKQPRGFYPYFVHALNPRPGTWRGRSDTQHQGPVQDRINRKKSDQEIARWLSTGGRGVADTSQIDGAVVDNIKNLAPGEILKANMQGEDIRKALIWLEVPYFAEAFNMIDDEADERLMHRMPAASLGVTDAKTTATAINTAVQGSQIAFNDRQTDFNSFLGRVVTGAADIVVQEDRPEDVRKESGPNAVWPKVHKESEAKRIEAAIVQRVNQIVTDEIQGLIIEAQMSGTDIGMTPEEMQTKIDQRIYELTEAEMLKAFGYPEPLTREGLFKRLQIKVRANMNAALDRERRVMSLTALLHEMIGLGVPINPEPVARLLMGLMGEEDEFSNLFKPDPNQLVQMLAQIAQADPSAITPESAAMVAKLGMLAQEFLMQQGIDPATGQPAAAPAAGAAPAEGAAPAPAPAPVAGQPATAPAQAQPVDPATGQPAPAPAPGVVINMPPVPPAPLPPPAPQAWKVVRDSSGKVIGIAAAG